MTNGHHSRVTENYSGKNAFYFTRSNTADKLKIPKIKDKVLKKLLPYIHRVLYNFLLDQNAIAHLKINFFESAIKQLKDRIMDTIFIDEYVFDRLFM